MPIAAPAETDGIARPDGPRAVTPHHDASEGVGLHGRTIAAALDLLRERQAVRPRLDEIAAALDEPVENVAKIFPDAEAVLIAAGELALVRLMDTCVKSVVKVDPEDAVGQFCSLGEAYVEWADTYAMQFKMLSDQNILDTLGTPQLRRYLNSLSELMTRMLERAQDAGHLPPDEDIRLMVLSSRTFAYGLARMVVDQRMGEWYPELPPMEAAKLALHDFVRRIARGSIRRPDPRP